MNLQNLVSKYFNEKCDLDFQNTLLVRSDGIVVFSSDDIKNEAASIGALIGGVWQGASALHSFVSDNSKLEEYRLAFDMSDGGIYIMPILINDKEYYLGTLYRKTFNPALLKRNFRVLKQQLKEYIQSNFSGFTSNREEYLFTDISDEEMDRLFAL